MADDMGEKTEAATPRRRQEARDEGQVVRSSDLNSALLLLGAVLLLGVFSTRMFHGMRSLVAAMLSGSGDGVTDVGRLVGQSAQIAAQLAAPVMLGLLALSITSGLIQSGFLFTGKPLMPQFSRISPMRGIQQILSMRGVVKLAMNLLKVSLVLAIAASFIAMDSRKIMSLMGLTAEPLVAAMSSLVWQLALKVALLLLVLGLLDYAYHRWQQEKDMRMSKQEVKEEFKRMEGDPLIKQRRAKVARQIAMQRVQRDVPKADVVVTNPTHFAIALRYEGSKMSAPKVIAKGADFMALRIRQVAAAHGVPIVERPPLARALYAAVEVGQQIPPEHYTAVAEILAYVYRINGGRKSA
jgi:flagellar biosynthetic protein FlhB